jgi:hypothetical protein
VARELKKRRAGLVNETLLFFLTRRRKEYL